MSDSTPTSLEPDVYAELEGALAERKEASAEYERMEPLYEAEKAKPLGVEPDVDLFLDFANAIDRVDAANEAVAALAEQILEEHQQFVKRQAALDRKELDWEVSLGLYSAPDPSVPGARWSITSSHYGDTFVLTHSKELASRSYGSYPSIAQAQAKAQAVTFGEN